MNITETAACLAELGNEKRLSTFRYLIKKGKAGAPVWEIQKELGIPASTLSHHIAHLVKVGLLEQERQSRTLICRAQYPKLEGMINFLLEECCSDDLKSKPKTSC